MNKITDFEVIDHGCMYSDYFQGCGTSFTPYTDVATGIGSDLNEAIDDALEQLTDWETEGMETRIVEKYGEIPEVEEPEDDCYYFVSIRVAR